MERSVLKRSTLAFRHLLEGYQDGGTWVLGDLELVLRGYGIFHDRDWLDRRRRPLSEGEGAGGTLHAPSGKLGGCQCLAAA
jgi:hypothetical protein